MQKPAAIKLSINLMEFEDAVASTDHLYRQNRCGVAWHSTRSTHRVSVRIVSIDLASERLRVSRWPEEVNAAQIETENRGRDRDRTEAETETDDTVRIV